MKKIIRVKRSNVNAAMAAIPGSSIVGAPSYIQDGVDQYGNGMDILSAPAQGMKGLVLPDGMSGKQANRLLAQAGVVYKGYQGPAPVIL